MRKIRIFLASSIGELKMDRLAVSEMTLELNNTLIDGGIRLQLFMCEHFDTAVAAAGKQNEYNDFIRQPCDLFINLYYRKLGEYTLEEYHLAIETKKRFGLPQVYIFVKDEENQANSALASFCGQAASEGALISHYTSLEALAELYQKTVVAFIRDNP
jgi:hypothetical protein